MTETKLTKSVVAAIPAIIINKEEEERDVTLCPHCNVGQLEADVI